MPNWTAITDEEIKDLNEAFEKIEAGDIPEYPAHVHIKVYNDWDKALTSPSPSPEAWEEASKESQAKILANRQ